MTQTFWVWVPLSVLLINGSAAVAAYKLEAKHIQGDDVITVTEVENPEFKVTYKGGDSEKIHEEMAEFVPVTGRARPMLWTEWSSGQTGVVKVFDLNCEASKQLRLDRQTYGVPSRTVDGSGFRVMIMSYDPFMPKRGEPRMVEWLIPLSCDEKPRALSKPE